jgi:hypothetical protein
VIVSISEGLFDTVLILYALYIARAVSPLYCGCQARDPGSGTVLLGTTCLASVNSARSCAEIARRSRLPYLAPRTGILKAALTI